MDTLLGIVRGQGGLTARLVRQNLPAFESREALLELGADPWYEIADQSLTALPPALFPGAARLSAAWEMLGRVSARDTEAARVALRLILAETTLGTPAPNPPAAPDLPTPAPRPAPTAAHPRAYRGTTYQPPRPSSPAPADLRPGLCGTLPLGILTDAENARRASESRLPERFRTTLFLAAHGEAETAEALAAYWTLSLEDHPARLAAVAVLFRRQGAAKGRAWCEFAAGQADKWRTPLLGLLLASGADALDPQRLPESLAGQVAEVLGGADPLYRAYWLLRGLTTGIAPDYLVTGFRLAGASERPPQFHKITRSGYFPEAILPVLWDHLQKADEPDLWYRQHFWERCGQYEGLGTLVETTAWMRYAPGIASQYLDLFVSFYWDELTPEQDAAKWQCLRQQAPAIEALLQNVPAAFQRKALEHLSEYFWQWDTPQELEAHLPSAYDLTRRLCQPPFSVKDDPTRVIVDFLAEVTLPLRERFLNAPDTSFRKLEDACRRDNDAFLVGGGTWALTRQAGEFAVRCFEECPASLFKVAKLLGSLSGPRREQVVRDAALDESDSKAGLERLERAALDALSSGLPAAAETSADRHALQMQRPAAENRRALRRLLDAHRRGETDYLWNHSQTRLWRGRHPGIDWNVWRGGLRVEGISDAGAAVTLTTETDPLEALKLGTYVGSCLGLGGGFAYSAAAIVLDLNKQVIYARNTRGKVVGRQVVALSEKKQIVCFQVYPLNTTPQIDALFAEYDRQLAAALGLPLHDPHGEDDYEIAHILSHDWWDDGPWDLTVSEGGADD